VTLPIDKRQELLQQALDGDIGVAVVVVFDTDTSQIIGVVKAKGPKELEVASATGGAAVLECVRQALLAYESRITAEDARQADAAPSDACNCTACVSRRMPQ